MELFLEQVRKLFVAREAKVDEDRFAARTKQHIGGLQIEMEDMLLMQIAQGIGDGYPAPDHVVERQALPEHSLQEGQPRHVFHDDVRLHREVAVGEPPRHMRRLEFGHDHLLDLKADEQRQLALEVEKRHLHDDRNVDTGAADAPDRCHSAAVNPLIEMESVDRHAGAELSLRHAISFLSPGAGASACGRPRATILRAVTSTSYGTRT